MTLSSRIGVMDEGRIVQVGEPREIYEFPHSRFVADFIGSVNILEGRVSEDAQDYVRIRCEEADCNIHVSHGVSCSENQKLWFALRPEKISLTRQRPEGDFNVIKGVVDEIAYLGNLSVYRVALENGKILRVTKSNLDRHSDDAITWNETVHLSWDDNSGVILVQ